MTPPRKLSFLNALARSTSSATDSDAVGRAAVSCVMEAYAPAAVAFYAWEYTTVEPRQQPLDSSRRVRELHIAAQRGLDGVASVEPRAIQGRTVFRHADRYKRPMETPVHRLDPELKISDTHQVMIVPLVAQTTSMGALLLIVEPGRHDALRHPELLEALSYQLGMSLKNIALMQDIERTSTALEGAGARMFQSERLAVIGMLASGIAHEINNPSSFVITNLSVMLEYVESIVDYLDLVEEHVQETPSEEGLSAARERLDLDYMRTDLPDLLERSLGGMNRIHNIVRNLRVFSYDNENTPDLVDVHTLLNSVIALASTEIKGHAEIVRNYSPTPLPRFSSSRSRLTQVFLNLLLNAYQAIDGHAGPERRITLHTRTEGEIEPQRLVVEVEDTGGGIDPKHIERIFEPFFTTKPAGQGTGLGLALSQDIIEKLGGTIQVDSRLGLGTTFKVTLPLQ